MLHCFSDPSRRAGFPVILLLLIAVLTACGGQQPTVDPKNTISITRTDGTATLARAIGNGEGDLPDSAFLAPGDQLYTAPNHTVTLQFPDGSTLQLGSGSHLVLISIRLTDRVPIFRLLSGSVNGDMRSNAFEVQAYVEVAMNFSMVMTDLTTVPRGVAGTYQLGFDGNTLEAVVNSGEFDMQSGNQQATLPAGWEAIAEPGKPFRVVSLITPTPAPPSAAEAPTATPIQIISVTPADTLTETPFATETAVSTATDTPTSPPTIVPRTIIANTPTPTPTPTIVNNTPIPAATEKPVRTPKPTSPPPPPPTNPPPTNPPPQPTKPPPQPTQPPRPTIPGVPDL